MIGLTGSNLVKPKSNAPFLAPAIDPPLILLELPLFPLVPEETLPDFRDEAVE